jgi:DtxR family transcriptional regulator, Mn-dependent transcriptional regulator
MSPYLPAVRTSSEPWLNSGMEAELTVSREDYLKAIIEAESEGSAVLPILLAERLDVSPPAVTKAVRRLRDDGFVEKRSGTLRLTRKGRQVAHRTAFRHYLVERMLAEVFGMEWHQIHAEAERLEHVISPEFERKLIEKLGQEATCPHGNYVLPESPAQARQRGLLPLAEAKEGGQYQVVSLYERDMALLTFLHQLGIGPQVIVDVKARTYDTTLHLRVANRDISLGLPAAQRILVQPVSAE